MVGIFSRLLKGTGKATIAEPGVQTFEVRPLTPIVGDDVPTGAITPETIVGTMASATYAKVLDYCENYPPRSFMSNHSRATLFTLIRALRPKVVAEVGTLFAGTTEVMARALWQNGEGIILTTDPLGGERCPAIIGTWPQALRDITHFHALTSMDFFTELDRKRVTLDLVLVDGNHDFEFALFDLQMAARLLRPGGVIVMDNAEQTGPFLAARTFLSAHPAWRELGQAIASYDPSRPFDPERASVPGTTFVVLQAPPHLSIGSGPHSWGQMRTKTSRLDGLSLELPAQVTAGTLYYQAILRAFYENGDVPEFKTFGGIRLDLSGPATVLNHTFEKPMRFDEGAQYTFEIDLSWQADPGASSLALATIPAPLANARSP